MLNELIEKQINSMKSKYVGSLELSIIGDDKIVLEEGMKLAFLNHVGATHYKIDIINEIPYIAFYCRIPPGINATPLPMLHDSAQCAEIAHQWIKNIDFNKSVKGYYTGDGTLKRDLKYQMTLIKHIIIN